MTIIYDVEDRLFARGRFSEAPAIGDARAAIERAVAAIEPAMSFPDVRRSRHGSTSSSAESWPDRRPAIIRLVRDCPWYVIWHETAHAIADWRDYESREGHGRGFVRLYASIIGHPEAGDSEYRARQLWNRWCAAKDYTTDGLPVQHRRAAKR